MAPAEVVKAFLYAVMRDKDFDRVSELIAEDVVYENVGYSTMRGGRRLVTTFRNMSARMPAIGWDVRFHRVVSDGPTVLTERTDSIVIGRFQAHFWVCGVFELRDGRVVLWRDYFDLADMAKGTLRGLLALAVPALRRRPA